MALILHLETATKVCSVSIAQDGKELYTKEVHTEHYSHGENLNIFIEEVMKTSGKKFADLDAISVSEGPGSYTGLRIGASTAKGLCYALDKPMIAINSLKSLAALVHNWQGLICPMFDAMRMEVYAALYDTGLKEIEPTKAIIVDGHFLEIYRKEAIIFVGSGVEKCIMTLEGGKFLFDLDTQVSARGMISLAEDKFAKKEFVDVAYFEPFYLKDFVAVEKKSPL